MPANDRPIIIKRIKKVEGGHHGGAWKVAYADFTTAMMAFFILLWLLSPSSKVELSGLADYFTPSDAKMSNSAGFNGILVGRAMGTVGANNEALLDIPQIPANIGNSGQSEVENENTDDNMHASKIKDKQSSKPDAVLEKTEKDIKAALMKLPEFEKHKDQILFEQTPDGLKIQLIDKKARPMFKPGSDILYPFTKRFLQAIAKGVKKIPNRMIISGHTDNMASRYRNGGNWELSSDRASSSRRTLAAQKLSQDRFLEVSGKASVEPLYPDSPGRPENRRITILLKREAPVVSPDFLDGAPRE